MPLDSLRFAGNVGGKQAEAEETNHVHPPRDAAEESRKTFVNWHNFSNFVV